MPQNKKKTLLAIFSLVYNLQYIWHHNSWRIHDVLGEERLAITRFSSYLCEVKKLEIINLFFPRISLSVDSFEDNTFACKIESIDGVLSVVQKSSSIVSAIEGALFLFVYLHLPSDVLKKNEDEI